LNPKTTSHGALVCVFVFGKSKRRFSDGAQLAVSQQDALGNFSHKGSGAWSLVAISDVNTRYTSEFSVGWELLKGVQSQSLSSGGH